MTITPDTGEFVRYEIDRHIVTITIDSPGTGNAVDGPVALGLSAAIDALESDDDVWVGIITGVPPVFCVGADQLAVGRDEAAPAHTRDAGLAGLVERDRTTPLIAAVDGPASAEGAEIALACDLVVASTDSTFGIPAVRSGLVASAGGSFRLGRKIPFNRAMEIALTGDSIDCATAVEYGLVNASCMPGDALETARILAQRITTNAPVSVRETRAIMIETTWADDATAWRRSVEATATVMATQDRHEGVSAFLEKRPPRWSGR
ncbi:enoyl-CoA hydratase-related protein [Rhodococcoides yunnanense]|uniref:enoyl-CoA hydratase-related protein n=1 Tax=Rhodococcoides yunnanense TaxID=278209 RepID=UPI0009332723|nr:enoyl-CoA hydratase-related protein [Rhodococcus yunnanensis]